MVELRQQRLVIARLVASFGIPDPDHVDRHRHGESSLAKSCGPGHPANLVVAGAADRDAATFMRLLPTDTAVSLYNVTLTLAGWVVTPRCSAVAPDHPRGETPLRSSVRAFQ